MRMRRNLIAGLSNSVWSAMVGLVAVPFYLKYLGIEAYGLIGFFVMAQAILTLLDLGLSPTINREVARNSATGDISESGGLLHSLAVVFWVMAGLIALLFFTLSSVIAEYWLQANNLPQDTVVNAIILMGLVIACRWPVGLYQGALIGAQRLTIYCGINAAMVTLGSLGAVAVLAFISPTIEAFFIWQACVGLLFAVTMRYAAWRVVGRMPGVRFDLDCLKKIWRFTAGVGAIGVTSLVFTQLDKIILSKLLVLEEFGHYMLATVVISGLYVLVTPLFNVMYPRFSALVAAGKTEKLIDLYRLGTRMLATVLFPVAMLLAVFSEDLVFLWTGDQNIALSVGPIISLLVLGSALNGVMYFPYALQLAYGMTWIPLTINIVLMLFLAPLIIYLAQAYGAIGGAMAWLFSEAVYVMFGPWLTHRHLLKGFGLKWLFQDVGGPLILSSLIGVIAYFVMPEGEYSGYEKIMWAIAMFSFTPIIMLLMSRKLRVAVRGCVKWSKS